MLRENEEDWRKWPWETVRRLGLTLLAVAVLLLLGAIPFHLGRLGEIRPAFLLIAVYYWAVMRPETLPPLFTFLAGIALDLLAGYPLGMNALTLVAAQWITRVQRKFLLGQPFAVIWAGLAIEALAAGILQWALFSLFYLNLMSIRPALMSALLTAIVFPLTVPPLAALNRLLVRTV